VQGNFAYVADRSYVTVVDVSLPSSPIVRGSVNPPVGWPVGLFVIDTLVYVNNNTSSSFTVINVADVDSPYVLGIDVFSRGTPEPKGVFTIDTLVYLASASIGLHIINVSDPANPNMISTFDTPGIAVDLYVRDTLVYLADGDSLQIINVSNPISPIRVSAVDMPSTCYDVFVSGNYAYVAVYSNSGNDGSLQVIDVSDPTSPSIVSSVNTINGDPFAVYVQGNYAYIVAQDHFLPNVDGGVRIVDISNPLNPILVASYDTPGDPRDVFAIFPYIYVTDQDSLQILEHIITGVEEKDLSTLNPPVLTLLQNYPNPFNKTTLIRYHISNNSRVTIRIYDVLGRLVRTLVDEQKQSGYYSVFWDGKAETGIPVASGSYYYQLKSSLQILSKKMLVIY
jgi:hypothetical protein